MTWTPRNTINVIITLLALGAIAYAQLGGPLPPWLPATTLATSAGALLVGLTIPGSPIGRLLDQVFPMQNTPKLTPDQAQQLVDDVRAKAAPPPPVRIPPSSTSGFIDAGTLFCLAGAGAFAIAAAIIFAGCGASAIRTHGTIAHELHGGVQLAGATISGATDIAIARCPHDDGDARSQCLDSVQHEMVAAAALRDAMIAPVDTYRALTLAACNMDPADPHAVPPDDCDPPPAAVAQIEAAAPAALHDLPALIAALQVLGVPVPAGLLGGGQ